MGTECYIAFSEYITFAFTEFIDNLIHKVISSAMFVLGIDHLAKKE
jgi:hypothetical protein